MKPKQIKLKFANNAVIFDPLKAEWRADIKSKQTIKAEQKSKKLQSQLRQSDKQLLHSKEDLIELKKKFQKLQQQKQKQQKQFIKLSNQHYSLKKTRQLIENEYNKYKQKYAHSQ